MGGVAVAGSTQKRTAVQGGTAVIRVEPSNEP
jgi:hypothetical protein